MMTTDPLTLLQNKSVERRAEATRYYEQNGNLEDIEILLDYAQNDPSIAIRNNAADAISDILSRYRTGPNKNAITREKRLELMNKFRKVSPNKSAVVYLMYAALGIPEVLPIIAAAFFDPRTEFRISAAIGLKCYCLSGDLVGDTESEQYVVSLLSNSRLDGDSVAHIARVCAEAGYVSAMPTLQNLSGEGLIGETITAAIDQLKKASRRPIGIWSSDGLDSMEYNPKGKRDSSFVIISGNNVVQSCNGEWEDWPDFDGQPSRQLLFRRIEQPAPGPAIQCGGKTWYFASSEEIESLVQPELDLVGEANKELETLGDILQPRALDDSKAWRNIALLYLRARKFDKALKAAHHTQELKRAPRDIHFIKAELMRLSGKTKEARELYQKCLSTTRSERSVLAKLCTNRIEQLG
jgi:tetratricopeptide (TPR) repeat protein